MKYWEFIPVVLHVWESWVNETHYLNLWQNKLVNLLKHSVLHWISWQKKYKIKKYNRCPITTNLLVSFFGSATISSYFLLVQTVHSTPFLIPSLPPRLSYFLHLQVKQTANMTTKWKREPSLSKVTFQVFVLCVYVCKCMCVCVCVLTIQFLNWFIQFIVFFS